MAKKFILESTLTAIADAIRAKKGTSATIDPANFATEIASISTGSSSGGDSGSGGSSTPAVEGGYTINFYDYKENLIETTSAKCGNYIDAPLSFTPQNWTNKNGYVNSFPLTVSADSETKVFDLYASANSYEDMLYSHFGVDKEAYPYVCIFVMNDKTMTEITFTKTYTENSGNYYWLQLGESLRVSNYSTNISTIEDLSDIAKIANLIISENASNSLKSTSSPQVWATSGMGNHYIYTNFNPWNGAYSRSYNLS